MTDLKAKFAFLKSLLNLNVEDIVNAPNKNVKVASTSKTVSEWCNHLNLTLSSTAEHVRKQIGNINLPNELLNCLPHFNELSRRVKQEYNNGTNKNNNMYQEKIFDAFATSKIFLRKNFS